MGLTSKFKAFRGHPANVSRTQVPTALSSSSSPFLGIPTVIKSLKIGDGGGGLKGQQKCKRGGLERQVRRQETVLLFVGMETCSVWHWQREGAREAKGQPRKGIGLGDGDGMCVSALTPNCQLLSSPSIHSWFSGACREEHSSIFEQRVVA